MEPVISLENVSFAYGVNETVVLNDVSLQVNSGDFLGIIGPNGGGKTTLLKLIMGFLKPTHGKILVYGKSPVAARNKIAYVPQAIRFDRQFPISVLELVLAGCLSKLPWYGRYSQQDKEAALEALKRVGLADFSNASFGTLSGGQAQRALIARALVSKPQLLLLDEPTASVDSQAESTICELLKELRGTITMLMVTHDLRSIIREVQSVICVQGEIYALKPQEVCEHFAFGLYHPPLIKLNGQHSE